MTRPQTVFHPKFLRPAALLPLALIAAGDSEPDPSLDVTELAAWTNLAGAVLNLDETVTRE